MNDLGASAVARLLFKIGQRLMLTGENLYKARAYTRAAESLLTLSLPLDDVIAPSVSLQPLVASPPFTLPVGRILQIWTKVTNGSAIRPKPPTNPIEQH